MAKVKEIDVIFHGKEYTVIAPHRAACNESKGRALISYKELDLLRTATRENVLPAKMSDVIHSIKLILGGELISCVIKESK